MTDSAATPPPNPTFTLIAAAYNVDRYLDDFVGSIEQQQIPLEDIEVIVVDDGSTDGTLTTLNRWADRQPSLVTVLSKRNGGQASARNLGLERATGEWVSFIDPDDGLDHGYLKSVKSFLRRHGDGLDMLATNRLVWDEASGRLLDQHPLNRHFKGGDRIVDLDECPDHFHGAVNAGFFRRSELHRQSLRFSLEVRPNFEDGHFCCHYLLGLDVPRVGYVASAKYHYRRRADETSTVQTALMDPDRFVKVPRHGYLQVLQAASARRGRPPEWLQNFVLYELSYYFEQDARSGSTPTAAQGDVADEFVGILGEIAQHLEPRVVEAFDLRRFDSVWRDILMHSFVDPEWVTPYVVVPLFDRKARMQQVRYRFTGNAPDERLTIDGTSYVPEDHKVLAHDFWGHTLLRERMVWVPASGTLRVQINGKPAVIEKAYRGGTHLSLSRTRSGRPSSASGGLTFRARAIRKASVQDPVRKRFKDAWVLVDRLHAADDNAERLFRYLRTERPEINAWFVLEKDTPDWRRLHADGFGSRLVAYDSVQWKLLMLNCRHLVSSHADQPIVAPTAVTRYRAPEWRFTFLQHGVIKDDISRWLNTKTIDLFVTSTPAEHQSIVGNDSPYKFTTREVRMTGMPRFDRLRQMGERYPPGRRDLVLICPTWRSWLSRPTPGGAHRREVVDGFFESDWVRNWMAFLHDDRLREIADREHIQLAFLPHANMQSALGDFDLPAHVTPIEFAGTDVQALMARSIAFVTDYSSMAFNAAYLERPVVYFQFDAAEVMGGGHTGRYSYYDYVDDGFGPVRETAGESVEALEKMITSGGDPGEDYMRRIARAFPERDGKCCERTTQAILDLDRRSG